MSSTELSMIITNFCLKLIYLVLISFPLAVQAPTLVYNLKYRRALALGLHTDLHTNKNHLITSALPIVAKSSKHIVDRERDIDVSSSTLATGAVFNFKFFHLPSWWLELTTAVATERLRDIGTFRADQSRTGLDDIVFTSGFNLYPGDRWQIVLYGMGGIPTHRSVTVEQRHNFLVGTRFFSWGIGSEFSYAFIKEPDKSLIGVFQNRFVHLFSRKLVPILPADATLNPGNFSDLLCAIQWRRKTNFVQFGYDLTMFTNHNITSPIEIENRPNIFRNSFYVLLNRAYKKFLFMPVPIVLGMGSSVAFAKQYHVRNFAVWLSLIGIF